MHACMPAVSYDGEEVKDALAMWEHLIVSKRVRSNMVVGQLGALDESGKLLRERWGMVRCGAVCCGVM